MLLRFLPLFALAITGCAPAATWQNPNLPPAQWSADETACRDESEEDLGPQAYSAPDTARFDTPLQMVDRSEIQKQFAALVADCMERKGYKRIQ